MSEIEKRTRKLQNLVNKLEKATAPQEIDGWQLITQEKAGELVGKSRHWARDNVKPEEGGRYDPRVVVRTLLASIEPSDDEMAEITKQKKREDAKRAQIEREHAQIKLDQAKANVITVEEASATADRVAELLKDAISAIGKLNRPAQQILLKAIEKARDGNVLPE